MVFQGSCVQCGRGQWKAGPHMHKLEPTDTPWTSHICLWPPKIHCSTKEELASSATEVPAGETRWESAEPAVRGLAEPGRWDSTWGAVRAGRHYVLSIRDPQSIKLAAASCSPSKSLTNFSCDQPWQRIRQKREPGKCSPSWVKFTQYITTPEIK